MLHSVGGKNPLTDQIKPWVSREVRRRDGRWAELWAVSSRQFGSRWFLKTSCKRTLHECGRVSAANCKWFFMFIKKKRKKNGIQFNDTLVCKVVYSDHSSWFIRVKREFNSISAGGCWELPPHSLLILIWIVIYLFISFFCLFIYLQIMYTELAFPEHFRLQWTKKHRITQKCKMQTCSLRRPESTLLWCKNLRPQPVYRTYMYISVFLWKTLYFYISMSCHTYWLRRCLAMCIVYLHCSAM